MDIAMLFLTAVCALTGIIASIPVIRQWGARSGESAAINSSTPGFFKAFAPLFLAAFALLLSAFGLYRTYQSRDVEEWQDPKQEMVYAKSFLNETVELDGKSFDHCHFENVKLLYRGLGPTSFTQSDFKGSVLLGSDNLAIRNFAIADAELKKISTMIQLHSWVEMDRNGNVSSVQ